MDTTLLTKLNEWAGTKGIDYLSEDTGLSACFKWLVPKIEDPRIQFSKPVLGGNYWLCELRFKDYYIEQTGKTPALALCLAIEKLIDGESS